MRISQMVRTAIFTADLARSRRFYAELLGLSEVYYEGALTGESSGTLLGVPADAMCRAVILKVPGKPGFGMVGLFALDPAPPPLPPGGATVRVGEGCSVFYCSDLDPVVANIEAYGGTITGGPVMLVIDDKMRQREMTLRDPDGHLVNLIEADPDSERRPELAEGTPLA